MKKTLKVLTSVLTLLTANGIANAEGTIQGTMGVDLTIGAGCALSGSPVGSIISDFAGLSFGTHSSLDEAIEGSATPLSLACSTGTHYKVELDNGRNATGETRRMASTTGTFVSYKLFQDATYLTNWGSAAQAMTNVGTGVAVPLIVYGRVLPAAATPEAGIYQDTVTMTITW